MKKSLFGASLALSALLSANLCRADFFGSGPNSFEIEFVAIGNPWNPPDLSGGVLGSVPYEYRIGKFEISEQMIEKGNALGALGITKDARGPDKPATSVDWFEAAKFVNWLNTSAGHAAAYKFDAGGNFQLWTPGDAGYNANNRFRNQLAWYFLPSADEWYKAAYYDPVAGVYWDFPTGSNAPPIAVAGGTTSGTAVYNQDISAFPADIMEAGGLSPYGTMGQGGNVYEWEETELDLINDELVDYRGVRGGNWENSSFSLSVSSRDGGFPQFPLSHTGFRVASVVPEPSTVMLLFGWAGLCRMRSHKHS